jgi:cell wall-associated NlpC family hydrolase
VDRRLTPFNDRVAAKHLAGLVDAAEFVDGWSMQIAVPVADLRVDPKSASRDRQLLFGEQVKVFEIKDGLAFCQADKDGYVGYVSDAHFAEPVDTTHFVSVAATHIYPSADLKKPETALLSFGAKVRVVAGIGNFFETDAGHFIPRPHVRPIKVPMADPATVAQLFFGTPYLWGGNSYNGIDCSGLVQAAMLASGNPCPADSDLQQVTLGRPLSDDEAIERGDLLFWKGHVALTVDSETMIHASGHHMAVVYEPIADAIARILEQDGGPVTSKKRL